MLVMKVQGMTCGGCVTAVTNALTRAGVAPRRVDLASGDVDLDDGTDVARAIAAVEAAGFDACVGA